MKTALLIVSAIAAFGLGGCGSSAAPAVVSFPIALRATSDDGQPLPGVTFKTSTKTLGATNAAGELRLRLRGREGQVLPVSTICPPDFKSPDESSRLRLTQAQRLTAAAAEPMTALAVVCTRNIRDVVVIVHAENGPDLPVLIDGHPAGVTDGDGNAHILVHPDRTARSLSLSLDTGATPQLRPQNPSRAFELTGRDAALLFKQELVRVVPSGDRLLALLRDDVSRIGSISTTAETLSIGKFHEKGPTWAQKIGVSLTIATGTQHLRVARRREGTDQVHPHDLRSQDEQKADRASLQRTLANRAHIPRPQG